MTIDYKAITTLWQPHSSRLLTDEDGREIAANVAGLFTLLARWAAEDSAASLEADALVAHKV